MKGQYVKLGFLALLFICLYSNMNMGQAEVVWLDDFNDEDYVGWEIFGVNMSSTPPVEIPGEFSAQDGYMKAIGPEWNHARIPSITTHGTWSFDILATDSPTHHFYVYFMIDDARDAFPQPPNGYGIMVVTKEWEGGKPGFLLMKYLDGMFHPIKGYMTQGDVSGWHHLDITRENSGLMEVYLNGSLIISASDLSFNESGYFHVNMQSGQAIDNIEIHDEIRIWSDDFNDGNYDGWTIELGEWTVINETLQGQNPDLKRPYCALFRPSTVAYGTWSFDIRLQRFKSLYFSFIDNNSTFGEFGYYYELEIEPYSDFTNFILFKNEGSHFDSYEALYSQGVYDVLEGDWHHVDLTRELNGKFSAYIDFELLFVVVDNNIVTSEEFWIASQQHGSFIDNILVTDIVKYPMDITVDLYEAQVTQGDTVTVSAQIKDKFGDPIEGADVRVKMDDLEVIASDQQDGMYQALLDTSELLGMVEILVTAHKPDYLSSKSTHQIEVVSPASFAVSGLTLQPSVVEKGKQAAVTVEVENVGGLEGSHQLLVDIEGVIREEITITLDPGASETVFYEFFATEAGTFTVEVDGLTETLTVVEPASFELSNLIIEPSTVKEGESVTISVGCSNVGGVSGTYDVTLSVDGELEDTSSVTVDAGESTSVSFDVSATQEGTYSVEIGGLTGSYTVERLQRGIPGFPLESIVISILLVMVFWLIQKKR